MMYRRKYPVAMFGEKFSGKVNFFAGECPEGLSEVGV